MSRLLILCEYPTLLGGEMSMLSTLDAVQKAGFATTVACPPSGRLWEELGRRGVDRLRFNTADTRGSRPSLAQRRGQLDQLIGDCRPSLLHANSLSTGRLAGPVAASRGVPSVASIRDIVRLSQAAVRDLNCHTRLLAVSHATRDYHVQAGVSPDQIVVVYNGVDLTRFRPRTPTGYLHTELGLPEGAPLIGAVGQISLRKGFDVLIRGVPGVLARHPQAHFLFIGSRYASKDETRLLEANLHAVAAEPELGGRVHILPYRDDLSALLPELHVLVHPARQEPLGRVLLEAAAAGLPIVATDVGGTREIFPAEAEAAVVVAPGRPDALAEGIIRLMADDTIRRKVATSARRRAAAFDLSRAAAELIRQYYIALGRA